MKFYRRLKSLALIALISIAIVLSLEILLRLAGVPYKVEWVPSESTIAQFDPELGWSYLPKLSKVVRFSENASHPVHFDDHGTRVPSSTTELSHTRPSILFIGCSYTMGHGLKYEENFVGILGEMLGEYYQMVNLGVQAYGTDQAYLSLQKFAPQFNTKVVVYTFIEDHFSRNGVADRRLLSPKAKFLGTKPRYSLDQQGNLYQANKPLLYAHYHNSYLLDAIRLGIGSRIGTFPPNTEMITKKLILEMQRYCLQHNIRFIMVNWRTTPEDYDDFDDLGVEMVDTLDQAPPGWAGMLQPDDSHPNPAANRYVAELLRQQIQKKSS